MVYKNVVLWDLNGVLADAKRADGAAVRFLAAQRIPQGIITTVSGLEWQRRLREAKVSISAFQSITDADDFARHYCPQKPAKEAFKLALSRTAGDVWQYSDATFDYAVVVEDTLEHLSAAYQLGMTTVQVITDNQPFSLHATYIVRQDESPKAAIHKALMFGRNRP